MSEEFMVRESRRLAQELGGSIDIGISLNFLEKVVESQPLSHAARHLVGEHSLRFIREMKKRLGNPAP
jgi:hypothetical protein